MTPLVGNEYYDILFNLENDFQINMIEFSESRVKSIDIVKLREFYHWTDCYGITTYTECEDYFNKLKEKSILENNIEQKETKKGKFKI